MDREYLEDYEQKENAYYERLLRDVREDKFSFEKERYPPDERFVKLQKPVAVASHGAARGSNIWAQVPFSGSTILVLQPYPEDLFERFLFKISEIPKVIRFIKETGKLQIALAHPPHLYERLDYLESIFTELAPPVYYGVPRFFWGNQKEIRQATNVFLTIAEVRYLDFLKNLSGGFHSRAFHVLLNEEVDSYIALKLGRFTVTEDIENLMIDDPFQAYLLITTCKLFVIDPMTDLRCRLSNFTFGEIKVSKTLPYIYQQEDVQFPCEIGKFLLKKLTYAAQDMRACYELMDHYDAYDLRNVQESMNEAIVTNHPDIVEKSAEELSEILDNVWNDPTIPRQIKNLKRGLPISIAAIGSAVSAFTGDVEGFLAGLGFSVGAKFLDFEIEGIAEKLVKFFARSYQANVYDFKKKYKHRIVPK